MHTYTFMHTYEQGKGLCDLVVYVLYCDIIVTELKLR